MFLIEIFNLIFLLLKIINVEEIAFFLEMLESEHLRTLNINLIYFNFFKYLHQKADRLKSEI